MSEHAGFTLDVVGPRADLTLRRPEKRNAQTPTLWRAIATAARGLPDSVRVVVVAGEGASFSAGLDRAMLDPTLRGVETVAGLLAMSDAEAERTIAEYQEGFTWLRDPRFVSIAAVQGHAVGAGFQLALACDLRVLADDAQLCMKEVALGLVPDLAGTKPLVHAVGYARALEVCATARTVGAEEAVRIGLALTAVPPERLATSVDDLVDALLAAPAGAVRETQGLLLRAAATDHDTQERHEREAQVRRFRALQDAGVLG